MTGAQVYPTALALFNSPALPGEPGKWLIPNDGLNGALPSSAHIDNAFLPGTGRFTADLAVADLDYNASSKDTLAVKYYYQHDPTIAPYSYSSVPGFTEHLDSGAQVFSITNTYLLKSNLSTTQTSAFCAKRSTATNEQPFGPDSIPGGAAGTGYHQRLRIQVLPRRLHLQRARRLPALRRVAGHPQHRPQRRGPGPQHRRLSEPHLALRQRHLDPRQAHRQLRRQLQLHPAQHHRQAHRHRHHRHRRLQPIRPGLRHSRQLRHRLLRQLLPAGQRQPLLPRQPARHLRAGQVPDHPDPLPHRRRPLRLGWRPDREIRPHLQLRSQASTATTWPATPSTTPA